jgi:hypothetical protein
VIAAGAGHNSAFAPSSGTGTVLRGWDVSGLRNHVSPVVVNPLQILPNLIGGPFDRIRHGGLYLQRRLCGHF